MKAAAEFFDKEGYLLIRALIPWTEASAKRLIDDSKGEASKRGYERLLLDLRAWSAPADEFVRFASGQYLAQVLGPPFKVAAFAAAKDINRFGENAAVNRGAIFRIFEDERPALVWLMGRSPP